MGELNSMSKDESFTIDFGSYTLPNFKASSDNPADSTSSKNVDNQAGTLASSQSTSAAASSKTGRGAKLSKAFNDLKDLGFSIPLIENPANIIKLRMLYIKQSIGHVEALCLPITKTCVIE